MNKLFLNFLMILILIFSCDKEEEKIKEIEIPVSEVSINKTEGLVIKGKTIQLTANVLPENATNNKINWISSNPFVALVDTLGKVYTKNNGKVNIVAYSDNQVKDTCSLLVVTNSEGISISPEKSAIEVGDTILLTAKIIPEDVSDNTVLWESQDSKIVSVDDKGQIVGVSVGNTNIVASTTLGQKAFCNVKVVSPKPINPGIIKSTGEGIGEVYLLATEEIKCDVDGELYTIPSEKSSLNFVLNKTHNKTDFDIKDAYKDANSPEPLFIELASGQTLTIHDISKITHIVISKASLTDVDFKKMPELKTFALVNGNMNSRKSLDFSECKKIFEIFIRNIKELEDIDITGCEELTYFGLDNTSVSNVDFSTCKYLFSCSLTGNLVEKIDLSSNDYVSNYIFSDTKEAFYIKEIILSDNLMPAQEFFFLVNGPLYLYPEGFIIKCFIDQDPNSLNLKGQYRQLFFSMACNVPFKGVYALQLEENGSLWRYNIEAAKWQNSEDDISLESVSIDPKSLNLEIGETYQLKPKFIPENATNKEVKWTSSNPDVIMVDRVTGFVTALSNGQADICIKTEEGGLTDVCSVCVGQISNKIATFTNNGDYVTYIDVSTTENVKYDINGVEGTIPAKEWISKHENKQYYFRAYECRVNPGETLTVYDQSKINYLSCSECNADFDLKQMSELAYFSISKSSVDVSKVNVSNCPKLEILSISDLSDLKELDITSCRNLYSINLKNTSVSELDFSNSFFITDCGLLQNELTKVDLSMCSYISMYSFGNRDDNSKIEEITLCPEQTIEDRIMFLLINTANSFPDNFKVEFLINQNPNDVTDNKKVSAMLKALSMVRFENKYIIDFEGNGELWRYNKDKAIWEKNNINDQ